MTKLSKPFYETLPAGFQNAVNLFSGTWKNGLPAEYSYLKAGDDNMFERDSRPSWVDQKLPGGLRSKVVIELGPFEAYQTYLLERLGATVNYSIESNSVNFLKCLLVKNILGLKAQFLLGDFTGFLESHQGTCDLIWASGVLYHQTHPLALLKSISKVSNGIFLWTHFFQDQMLSVLSPDLRSGFVEDKNITASLDGFNCLYHYRSYGIENYSNNIPGYWEGGSQEHSFWLELDDIRTFLDLCGYKNQVLSEISDLNGLPTIMILAYK